MSDFKQDIENRINRWKESLESLNAQLHLGASEAKDEFEKQKKNAGELVQDMKRKLSDAKHISEEKATELKIKLEELRVQATLGRAESKDEFKKQQEQLSSKIHEIQQKLKSAYESSKEFASDFSHETGILLDDLHTRFDMFRLHTHLAEKDAEVKWQERKKDISGKIQDLEHKLENGKKYAGEKWDHFSEEMSEAWGHFRQAFKND